MKNIFLTLSIVSGIVAHGASTRIVAVAHRGLHGPGVAQNSVESFKAAYAAGAKWIETDFHLLKNGRILCVHDRKELKRVSGEDRVIADLTEADVAAIDIGKSAKTTAPVHMPYLEDVLACVPKNAFAQCEIKLYGETYAEKFNAAVKAAGLAPTNILVTSFNYSWIVDFKKRMPAYRTLWLGAAVRKEGGGKWDAEGVAASAKRGGIDIICPGAVAAKRAGLASADADKIRAAGLEFRFFGVNSRDSLKYAAELGVTGFTCDHWKDAFTWAKELGNVELLVDYPMSGVQK